MTFRTVRIKKVLEVFSLSRDDHTWYSLAKEEMVTILHDEPVEECFPQHYLVFFMSSSGRIFWREMHIQHKNQCFQAIA